MKNAIQQIKGRLAPYLLRGSVLRWWVRGKLKSLEARYCQELLSRSRNPKQPEAANFTGKPGKLERIVLIADILWEQQELVPELEKLGALRVLDLGPALRSRQKQ